jgi:hypothetical protein
MTKMTLKRALAGKVALTCVCALVSLCFAQSVLASGGVRDDTTGTTPGSQGYSAAVEECVTSTVQSERSATFTTQIDATDATQRMGIKVELQQRMRGETEFHTLTAPGLGEWRNSETGVKIYKYVKQVTNLTAPAAYRALVHFRWLDAKGHVLKRTELHTARCVQTQPPVQVTATPTPSALAR